MLPGRSSAPCNEVMHADPAVILLPKWWTGVVGNGAVRKQDKGILAVRFVWYTTYTIFKTKQKYATAILQISWISWPDGLGALTKGQTHSMLVCQRTLSLIFHISGKLLKNLKSHGASYFIKIFGERGKGKVQLKMVAHARVHIAWVYSSCCSPRSLIRPHAGTPCCWLR